VTRRIPHLHVVVAVTFYVLIGFALVTGYVLVYSDDEVTKGTLIGTWINIAMLAVGFWLGSSLGGKAMQETATGKANDPVHVEPQEPTL